MVLSLLIMLRSVVFTLSSGWLMLSSLWVVMMMGFFDTLDLVSLRFDNLNCFMIILTLFVVYFSCWIMDLSDDGVWIMMLLGWMLVFLFSFDSWLWFYVLYEGSVLPLLYGIMRSGGYLERYGSGYYLILYMVMFSMPLLIWIVMVYMLGGTVDMFWLILDIGVWVGLIILAFLVKVPMYGLHSWLPKVHVEAPMWGSVILAAVLIKMGVYGLYLMVMSVDMFSLFIMMAYVSFSVVGGLLSGLLCMENADMKVIIAFSSVFHMMGGLWLVMLNIISGLWGTLLLLLFHGLVSSGLFILVGVTSAKVGGRSLMLMLGVYELLSFSGVIVFSLLFMNMGFPISFGFLGEMELFKGMSVMSLGWVFILIFMMIGCLYNMYLFTNLVWGQSEGLGLQIRYIVLLVMLSFLSCVGLFLFSLIS
uniref:NADH-ubiquinone oxidoreductase chain 4 n=1 Tax=Brentisentis yangtzensis TaxID=2604967 RepID=A0A5B9RJY7_9BILA|nr:NADH dehydrogenase subunit 4 [Brentisentis yangtzensis]